MNFSRFSIFEDVTPEQFALVGKYIEARSVAAGTRVLQQHETGGGLYLLHDGRVQVIVDVEESPRMLAGPVKRPLRGRRNYLTSQDDGREIVVATCGPGEVLGEIDLADGGGHTATVITKQACEFYWLSAPDFWLCHAQMPQLGRNLSRLLARRIRHTTLAQAVFASLDISGRVAFHLLLLARDFGEPQSDGSIALSFVIKQGELAALAGTSRNCVNRALATFQKMGWVQLKPDRRIVLKNLPALSAKCEGLAPRVSKSTPEE